MKGKKLLAGVLSAAMVLGTMAFPVFAEGEEAASGGAQATERRGTTEVSEMTFARFLDNIAMDSEDVNFDGSTYAGAGNHLKVTLKPQSVCEYGDCEGAVEPSEANPINLDSGMAQYKIWSDKEANRKKNVTVSNVDFVYEQAEFCIHTNSGWSTHPNKVNPENGQIQVLNTGNVEFDNCSFEGLNLNLYGQGNPNTKATINNCTFKNIADGAGLKWIRTSSAEITGNTFDNCKAGVMFAPKSGTPQLTVSGNTFSNITGEVIQLTGDAKYTAESNISIKENAVANPKEDTYMFRINSDSAKIDDYRDNTVAENIPMMTDDTKESKYKFVAQIGNEFYASLKDAVAAAKDDDTITIFGTVDADNCLPADKSVTFKGADEKAVLNFTEGAYLHQAEGKTLTFESLTMQWGNADYKGIKHSANLVYNDVTIKGKVFLYATNETFNKCKFIQSVADYNLWTYGAKNVEFNNCEFQSAGKSVLVYGEGSGVSTVVDVKDCTFNASQSVKGKAAIEIDSSLIPGEYTLNISGNTTATGFDEGSVSGNSLYNVKKYKTEKQNDNSFKPNAAITVDGKEVTAVPMQAKVIDKVKTTGATVELKDLHNNSAIKLADDATYELVVKTAPKADADKANEKIKTTDTNTSKLMLDIFVQKTDSNGNESKIDVTGQKVIYTLDEPIKKDCTVNVYHVNSNGDVKQIEGVINNGQTIEFTAPSFSTYAVTYTADSLADSDITKNIKVAFEPIAGTSSYDIVLKATDGGKINRFMTADLTFEMTLKEGAVNYTVTPAANIKISDQDNGRYEFNMDGTNASGATGANITIGTVTFEGTGTVDFAVKTAETNIVNTAKADDNIVEYNTTDGGRLDLSDKLTDVELKAPTKKLTVNVTFNNSISDNAAAYQDMKAVISGGDLTDDITVDFGSDAETKLNGNVYSFEKELTQNTTYTVKVEGAGYRTARYTVTMTGDKTLNFWNNVMDNAIVVEEGNPLYTRNVTFLAGDIVKDNKINIYDLSAVVSYFGTKTDNTVTSEYAKYDLNRDGVIDSKDVAYVLVSWGK